MRIETKAETPKLPLSSLLNFSDLVQRTSNQMRKIFSEIFGEKDWVWATMWLDELCAMTTSFLEVANRLFPLRREERSAGTSEYLSLFEKRRESEGEFLDIRGPKSSDDIYLPEYIQETNRQYTKNRCSMTNPIQPNNLNNLLTNQIRDNYYTADEKQREQASIHAQPTSETEQTFSPPPSSSTLKDRIASIPSGSTNSEERIQEVMNWATQQIQEARSTLEQFRQERITQRAEFTAQLQAQRTEFTAQLEAERQRFTAQLEAQQQQTARVTEQLDQINARLAAAEQQNTQLTEQRDRLTEDLTAAQQQNTRVTEQRDQLTANLAAAQQQNARVTEQRDQLTANLAAAQQQNARVTEQRDQLTANLAAAQQQNARVTEQRDQLTANLAAAQQQNARVTEQRDQLTANLAAAQQQNARVIEQRDQLATQRAAEQAIREERAQLAQRLGVLRRESQQLQQEANNCITPLRKVVNFASSSISSLTSTDETENILSEQVKEIWEFAARPVQQILEIASSSFFLGNRDIASNGVVQKARDFLKINEEEQILTRKFRVEEEIVRIERRLQQLPS